MRTARDAAAEIARHPKLELVMEPDLSVVIFRRIGWRDLDYEDWWNRVLRAQIGFVQPTTWEGEKVARLWFVNPRTTPEHTHAILGTMT